MRLRLSERSGAFPSAPSPPRELMAFSDRQRCSTTGSVGSWRRPTTWFCCRLSTLHLPRDQEAEVYTPAAQLPWCVLGGRSQPWQAYRTQVRQPIRDQLKLLHADESAEDAEEVLPLEGVPQVLVGQVQLLGTAEASESPLDALDTPTHLPDSSPSSPAASPPSSALHPSSSSSPNRRLCQTAAPPTALRDTTTNTLTLVP